ncbi:unnamed protein product [Euphydryas editha]|uniref:Myb-like domain-containing protein n=1 Tax=Euphydryas editha TaxID=104508 RepID=A0AAU9TUH3_EUPED|nr:unnamed protein product [Euphydryas editha]
MSNKPFDVVYQIVQAITRTNRNVTFDNWFNSYDLVQNLLKELKLTCVGILRKNKRQVPEEFTKTHGVEVFSSRFGFQKLLMCLKKIGLVMSSLHHNDAIDERTGEQRKPEINTYFNRTKCGADVADELCATYDGSASESEDESRRNLVLSSTRQRHDSNTSHSTHQSVPNREVSRVRNDSVCSSVSQVTVQLPPTGSPLKEKQNNKPKRQEVSRRMATMRRRRENVKRDNLTMYDLIFYNPTSNPIVPDEDEIKIQEANEREELERSKMKEVVEPEPPAPNTAPVPQIKLGPQGEIILDEESLVIKQTDSGRKITSVVHEGAWGNSNGYKYKRGPRAAEWSAAETVRFYRALAAIGTDFTLMAPLFPDRTRKELKIKFKKEEKLNGAQVDKALTAKVPWDVAKLKDEFKEERTVAIKRAEEERERLQNEKKAERERLKAAREMRVRQSKGAKALESTILLGVSSHRKDAITAEDIIERAKRNKPQRKRKRNTETSTEETSRLSLATLTPVSRAQAQNNQSEVDVPKMATPNFQIKTPDIINGVPQIPSNIETGSLVVLTVNDPSSPAKKMLQTYIANGPGKLTPVALPAVLLNSVVGYMKKNTSKGTYSPSSQIMSPSSVASHDSRTSSTLSGISVLPSPTQRQRHNSFTITQL